MNFVFIDSQEEIGLNQSISNLWLPPSGTTR